MKKVMFFALFAAACTLTSYATPAFPATVNPVLKLFKTYTANEQFIADAAGYEYNPCNGELVYFEGRIHYNYHSTYNDKTGDYKSNFHVNAQNERGIGDQGNEYNISFVSQDRSSVTTNGCVVTEVVSFTYNLVSKGSTDNFFVKYTYEVVFDFCNWTYQFNLLKSESSCRG